MDTSPDTDFIPFQTDFTPNTTAAVSDADTVDPVSNVSVAQEAEFTAHVEYQVARWLLLVYRPTCAAFGMTGNILSIIVVMTTSLRHSPTAVYMVTLAALDWVLSVFAC
ncbi:hypothetical protein BaRGS_00037187 [Batillaria attramentaria]|uniref:G-protein coupled receptors family 1 profile domain-containing protein n=1 Tax=Batillaria attramentaria TaxID=370345 RepID=A0ABD0J9M9_9CAEN